MKTNFESKKTYVLVYEDPDDEDLADRTPIQVSEAADYDRMWHRMTIHRWPGRPLAPGTTNAQTVIQDILHTIKVAVKDPKQAESIKNPWVY